MRNYELHRCMRNLGEKWSPFTYWRILNGEVIPSTIPIWTMNGKLYIQIRIWYLLILRWSWFSIRISTPFSWHTPLSKNNYINNLLGFICWQVCKSTKSGLQRLLVCKTVLFRQNLFHELVKILLLGGCDNKWLSTCSTINVAICKLLVRNTIILLRW